MTEETSRLTDVISGVSPRTERPHTIITKVKDNVGRNGLPVPVRVPPAVAHSTAPRDP